MSDAAILAVRGAARANGLALGAALVTILLWASAFVGIRDAGAEIGAGPLSLGRLLVGGAVLGALVVSRGEAWMPRSDAPRLHSSGCCGSPRTT